MYGVGRKALIAASIGRFEPNACAVKSGKSSKQVALLDILFFKYKSLVDIRKECINRFYPEKDVFVKNESLR